MRLLVESLAKLGPVDSPITPAELSGRWELLYSTVELFRASPFFQMVRNREQGRRPGRGKRRGSERQCTDADRDPVVAVVGGEDPCADSADRGTRRSIARAEGGVERFDVHANMYVYFYKK